MLIVERMVGGEWQVMHTHPHSKNLNKDIKKQVQQRNGRWVFKMLTREQAAKLIAKSMGLDVK